MSASVQLDALQGSIGPETFTIDSEWTVIDYPLQTEVDDEGRLRGRFLAALTDPDGLLWFNAVGVWPLPG